MANTNGDAPLSGMPTAIERILSEAAADPSFREQLLDDRLAAIEQRGYQLSDAERAMLEAVPAEQLRAMLDRLASMPLPQPSDSDAVYATLGIRPERELVRGTRAGRVILAAAATSAAVGAGLGLLCVSHGARPDHPPPQVTQPAQSQADSVVAGDGAAPIDSDPDGEVDGGQ